MHTQRRYATCSGMSEIKRCIPKEGMPHGHKACQKKRREKEKKIALVQKKETRERWFIQRSSSTIHQKYTYIHTLAHLDQGLWLVSPLDPIFDLAKYEKHVCLQILHTYSSTKIAIRDRLRKKGVIKSLGKEITHIERSERSSEELYKFLLKNFTKPPDWRLSQRERNMSTLWYRSDSQPPRMRWSYKLHRSKVRGKNKRPTYSKSR